MITEKINQSTNETFQQVLELSMKSNFGSRPPKLEISGVLAPIHKALDGKIFKFKIISDSAEYYLKLSDELCHIAKKIEWEEVTARGTLEIETKIFTVEKLSLKNSVDDSQMGSRPIESNFDLDFYTRTISKIGLIEQEPGYLAS